MFRCTDCRRRSSRGWEYRLTGRSKPRPPGRRTQRTGDLLIEYTCDCGHTGWSSHYDINRRFAREYPAA